ncbi:translocation protein-like protein sec66 [Paraphoma chrysanthemicola]|uniref:Translocation protein-like protein sec66 n=1 Tax=Paraphoma chrysanthemicola TaxID=798071 RepID=A0A8K0R5A7_9PLEO|nr:translocation protein-like protein sec66 [Paraphoma chrysanthemicola]KAH7087068.1 translocation protein-like protein sec66 [Paraphoma chrysanthemicola]
MWPFDAVDWLMLSIPIAYLVILVGSLSVFSNLYRKRQAANAASLEPWFPPHLQRNIYFTLVHQEDPKIPDSILKAALLRRATEDIHRIVQIRNAKQALQVLLQRGSVGDDLWKRFERAEKEIEEELRDVVQEANAFAPNWGQTIFQSASEMAQNTHIRERLGEIMAKSEEEKKWWESRKAMIQSDFMKELDEEKTKSSEDDAVLVDAGGPAGSVGKGAKKGKK